MKKHIPEEIKKIFREYGSKGGKATLEKYGREHFKKLSIRATKGKDSYPQFDADPLDIEPAQE